MRSTLAANETKTLSYSSPRCKRDRKTMSAMASALAKPTWPHSYEPNGIPGESIRYQYTDHSEQGGNIPECEYCLHIGLCQPQEQKTMLEKLALVPTQSFPETWKPKIGASVIVYTGGVAQQWRVNHIKIATGTSVTIKFENSVMTVDKSWCMFDTSLGSLVLQRLGFFGDMALKRTTNSFEVWRNMLNPEKMMDGKALMVLLEWTIYGCSGMGRYRLRNGWWIGLFGSPGYRKTDPNVYHQGNATNGCASKKSQCGVQK